MSSVFKTWRYFLGVSTIPHKKKLRVKNVKPPERQIDPFAKYESHLENIVTKAVMPGYIKKGRLTREEISQAFFDTFVQEKMLRPHKKGASQVMEVCLANKEKQNS